MKRINPHQILRGFIGPNGLKRIAYGNDTTPTDYQNIVQPHTTQQPIRRLTNINQHLLVCLQAKNGELDFHDQEIIYIGQVLIANQPQPESISLTALVFGQLNESPSAYGIDRIINPSFDALQHYDPTYQVNTIAAAIDKLNPMHILMPESEWGDSDIARRLAIKTGLSYSGDVVEINAERLIRYCNNQQSETQTALTRIIGLQAKLSSGSIDFACDSLALEMDRIETQLQENQTYRLDADAIPLEEAPLILSAGNGVKDMALFHQCAASMGASIAGSRVVVDDGKLNRDKQVGATGKTVNATLYIALGISGAVQHLQGIQQCQTVVAVNTDDTCAIIKRADVSVIADAQDIMHELINLCNERKDTPESKQQNMQDNNEVLPCI